MIARNTAFTYKGNPVDVKQIGRELGVRYVLEGSVRRLGDQVQVNVQLIDAESGAHVWADRFETDRTQPRRGAERDHRPSRADAEPRTGAGGRPQDRAGGRGQPGRAGSGHARLGALSARPSAPPAATRRKRAFERALQIDPKSYDAKLGIAAVLVGRAWRTASASSRRRTRRSAEELLSELLARDPNRSQLHHDDRAVAAGPEPPAESRIELERAIELDPNNAIAYGQLGVTLIYLGEPAAAIPLEEKRIRLNPNDPNIALAYWSIGLAHLLQDHLDEAIDWLTKARAANPRVYYFYLDLAAAQALKGDLDGAQAALAESLKLKPEINSMKRQLARWAYTNNPAYRVLAEKTIDAGLRKAGMPEE